MPTYEYECEKCGNRFEAFQRMTDPPLKSCPKCKGKVERLIGTGSGIIFKGSGFYATDYKKKRKNPAEDSKLCQAPKTNGCKGCSLNE
jgi:putative FmdB family regulatory protein